MKIGIDIGGTKCAVVLGDESGVKNKIRFDTTTKNETLSYIFDAVEKIGEADAIGISCGGPLDERNGLICAPPNLPDWDNVPIVSLLEDKTGLPVYLCKDSDACALAEWKFGAGRGTENMVFLTCGTGFGGGIISGGRRIRGFRGSAGEIGHIRLESDGPIGYGKAGSAEGFCSGAGIANLGKERAKAALAAGKPLLYGESADAIANINAKILADFARQGEPEALAIYHKSAEKLGECCAILADLLNPEAIVLGSIFVRCEDLLRPKLEEVFFKEALSHAAHDCRILPAELGESIGDIAALTVAFEGGK